MQRGGGWSGCGQSARIAALVIVLALSAFPAAGAPGGSSQSPVPLRSLAPNASSANPRNMDTRSPAAASRIDLNGAGLIYAATAAGSAGANAASGKVTLDQLVNIREAVVADSVSKVGDALVFTSTNTAGAAGTAGMPMAWTDMLDGLLATPVPTSDSSAEAELVVASNNLAGDRSWPDDRADERRAPYRAATILNRDFSGALAETWRPIGAGVRSVVTRTFVEGLPFVSPAERQGTFLRAQPAAPDSAVGVEQTITVAAGERITFAVLFSSPGHTFGDEVAVDLVRGDESIPLFMQNGVRAGDPAWQTVDHIVPPGREGTYKLRFTLVAGRSAADLPSAGFVVLKRPPTLQADRSASPGIDAASWAG